MVGLVALLVIGPERLPKVARLTGFWLGKARHMMAAAKAEISAELEAEELRQLMLENSGMGELQQAKKDLLGAAQTFNTSLEQLPNEVEQTGKVSLDKAHETK